MKQQRRKLGSEVMETMSTNQKIAGIRSQIFQHLTQSLEMYMYLTCLTVMLDLNPLVSEGPEPALFMFRLLGTQKVDLVTRH